MNKSLDRLSILIGKDKIKLLKSKRVMICGVGGVGSFVAEALARSGVGTLVLVDYDTIDESNLNRQLETNKKNIGKSKVKECKKHLESISDCEIEIHECFIDENFEVKDVDYVVDCIDTLTSKFILVKKCHENNIPVLSSLGTAKRLKIENIKKTTLDKTENDPLAKAFRNLVKKENYKHKINVVYSDSKTIETNIVNESGKTNKEKYPLGSGIFVVGSVGLYIASIVFEELIKD